MTQAVAQLEGVRRRVVEHLILLEVAHPSRTGRRVRAKDADKQLVLVASLSVDGDGETGRCEHAVERLDAVENIHQRIDQRLDIRCREILAAALFCHRADEIRIQIIARRTDHGDAVRHDRLHAGLRAHIHAAQEAGVFIGPVALVAVADIRIRIDKLRHIAAGGLKQRPRLPVGVLARAAVGQEDDVVDAAAARRTDVIGASDRGRIPFAARRPTVGDSFREHEISLI